MGELLKELQASARKSRVEEVVALLGADGEDFMVALRDPSVSVSRIREVLLKRGVKGAASTLNLWRREHGVA